MLKTVALYERDIYVCKFLRLPGDQAESDLAERLTKLRRYEFAARYGDYLSHVSFDRGDVQLNWGTSVWSILRCTVGLAVSLIPGCPFSRANWQAESCGRFGRRFVI